MSDTFEELKLVRAAIKLALDDGNEQAANGLAREALDLENRMKREFQRQGPIDVDTRRGEALAEDIRSRGALQAVNSFTQGSTLGLSDEIAGVVGGGVAAAGAALRGQDAGQAFRAQFDQSQAFGSGMQRRFREDAPITAGATEIVGGIASPAAKPLAGLGAVRGGAVAGGIYGAASADENRITSGAIGGLTGAAAGKAFEMLSAPIGRVISRRLNLQTGQTPAAALNARQQRAQEFGIELTRGQALQDPLQQTAEMSMYKGAKGASAQQVLRPFIEEQRTTALQAGRQMAGQNAGNLQDAGNIVAQGIKSREASLKAQINAAYEAARNTNASLKAESIPELVNTVYKSLDDQTRGLLETSESAARNMSLTKEALESTASLVNELQERTTQNQRPVALDFARIEKYRSDLGAMFRDAQGRDRRNLGQMRAALDGWLDSATDQALFEGDDAFLEAYKRARGLRAQYAQRFGNEGQSQSVLERIVKADADATQTINYIFGASKISTGPKIRPAVKQMKEILGANSDEFQALREAAALRLMSAVDKAGKSDAFPIATLAKDWKAATQGDLKPVMQELFTPAEMAKMTRYTSLLQDLVPMDAATINNSGTQYLQRINQATELLNGRLAAQLRRVSNLIGGFARDPMEQEALRAVNAARVVAPGTSTQLAIGAAPAPQVAFQSATAERP